jgi:L-lactate dehydrogenase complex protein LldG
MSKEVILNNIRKALEKETPRPYADMERAHPIYPIYAPEDWDVVFAENFTAVGGKFVYCTDVDDMLGKLTLLIAQQGWKHVFCWYKPLQDLLLDCQIKAVRIGRIMDKVDAAITTCEALIVHSGSIVVSSQPEGSRAISIYPPVHIVVAFRSKLVPHIEQALAPYSHHTEQVLPSMVSIVTGNSRTADIEKTLVQGAHGTKELYLFFIDC